MVSTCDSTFGILYCIYISKYPRVFLLIRCRFIHCILYLHTIVIMLIILLCVGVQNTCDEVSRCFKLVTVLKEVKQEKDSKLSATNSNIDKCRSMLS